jgi:hypothetical protein
MDAEHDDRLGAIETNLKLLTQEFRANNAQLQRIVTRHDRILLGVDEAPGLALKVDRLEQSETRRVWHVRALWSAVMALLARLAGEHLTK